MGSIKDKFAPIAEDSEVSKALCSDVPQSPSSRWALGTAGSRLFWLVLFGPVWVRWSCGTGYSVAVEEVAASGGAAVKDKQVGLAELAEQWILSSCKIFQLLFSGKAYSKALKEAEQFVWAGQEMDPVSAIFSSVNVRDMVKNMVTAKDWAESIRDTIQKVENWSCLGPNEEKVHLDHIADLLRFDPVHLDHIADLLRFDPVHLDHITQLLKVVILTPNCNIHSAPISSQLVKYSAVLPWLLALL
ncbi:hypothetical protein Ancab_004775 [Ancistrocladus abbreviatus]